MNSNISAHTSAYNPSTPNYFLIKIQYIFWTIIINRIYNASFQEEAILSPIIISLCYEYLMIFIQNKERKAYLLIGLSFTICITAIRKLTILNYSGKIVAIRILYRTLSFKNVASKIAFVFCAVMILVHTIALHFSVF